MTNRDRSRNRALLRYILLPMIFLTVALLGGLRIDVETKAFIFVPPPLITLILSVFLMVLFVRGHAVEIRQWIKSDQPALTNVSHVLTLLTLYFGSAQAFNTVLPERGLLFWLFSFFFLWTLWNNQFSSFDARRLLRSLAVLFGTAFFLKHMFLASLFSPEGGWAKKLTGFFVELGTLGTLDTQVFAPATGYISFFTLALYVLGLILLTPSPEPEEDAHALLRIYHNLPPLERMQVQQAIAGTQGASAPLQSGEALTRFDTVEVTGELVTESPSEETQISKK
ncbi:MAG: hypothetical protein QOH25_802 [Acidobacteriota bacterium]|jgi:hypothetical protein|nr:hypothetical protein [Acidobacteriota bacterium]